MRWRLDPLDGRDRQVNLPYRPLRQALRVIDEANGGPRRRRPLVLWWWVGSWVAVGGIFIGAVMLVDPYFAAEREATAVAVLLFTILGVLPWALLVSGLIGPAVRTRRLGRRIKALSAHPNLQPPAPGSGWPSWPDPPQVTDRPDPAGPWHVLADR